jgi:hypothetical protein
MSFLDIRHPFIVEAASSTAEKIGCGFKSFGPFLQIDISPQSGTFV